MPDMIHESLPELRGQSQGRARLFQGPGAGSFGPPAGPAFLCGPLSVCHLLVKLGGTGRMLMENGSTRGCCLQQALPWGVFTLTMASANSQGFHLLNRCSGRVETEGLLGTEDDREWG